MLRSFFAFLLEPTARVEPQEFVLFLGQYSAFSGIVTEISVGSLPQQLLVSLNFEADFVTLYRPFACPAFVEHCYSAAESPSFEESSDFIGLENGKSLGFVPFELTSDSRSSSRFSEVAGWIGASPRASIFESKALRIHEVNDRSVEIREVSPDDPPGDLEARFPIFTPLRGWVVHSRIRLQGQLLPAISFMFFDPGEQDLVIPDILRSEVLQILGGLGPAMYINRLVLPCNSALDVELVFPDPGLNFRLDSVNLFVANSQSPSRREYCFTRIRFDATIFSRIVVGRILMRSSGEVTLNFKHRWIGVSTGTLISEPFVSPVARIPVFQLPHAPRHGNRLTLTPIASPEDYPQGVVLATLRERGGGYSFIRILPFPRNLLHPAIRIRMDPFSYVEPPRVHTDYSVEFRLGQGDPSSEVMLVYSPTRVAILRIHLNEPSASLNPIASPAPEVHGDGPTVECPICLETIADGEVKRRIDPCMHYFHQSCLMRWVERTATPTCPICRGEIPRVIV